MSFSLLKTTRRLGGLSRPRGRGPKFLLSDRKPYVHADEMN